MTETSDLAVELAEARAGSVADWQTAVDACGSEERARWLLDTPPAGLALPPDEWNPDSLIVAHTVARLLEAGPSGTQSMYVSI